METTTLTTNPQTPRAMRHSTITLRFTTFRNEEDTQIFENVSVKQAIAIVRRAYPGTTILEVVQGN